jgi:hypothetical protein
MYAGQTWNVMNFKPRQGNTLLNSLIDALESRLNSREPANRSLVSLFNSLASHLEMYFELEVPEENFAEAARRSPQFVAEVKRLEAERKALLADVDLMIGLAKLAFVEKRDVGALTERYRLFQRRFAEHEAAEKKLVQDVFAANPALDG